MLKTKTPHIITFDNDKELTQHQAIAKVLNADIYFANPNHFWEYGIDKNTNGLIHQFLPKSMPPDQVRAE